MSSGLKHYVHSMVRGQFNNNNYYTAPHRAATATRTELKKAISLTLYTGAGCPYMYIWTCMCALVWFSSRIVARTQQMRIHIPQIARRASFPGVARAQIKGSRLANLPVQRDSLKSGLLPVDVVSKPFVRRFVGDEKWLFEPATSLCGPIVNLSVRLRFSIESVFRRSLRGECKCSSGCRSFFINHSDTWRFFYCATTLCRSL